MLRVVEGDEFRGAFGAEIESRKRWGKEAWEGGISSRVGIWGSVVSSLSGVWGGAVSQNWIWWSFDAKIWLLVR